MSLQWILLIISVLLIALIAWHSNRQVWRKLFNHVKKLLPKQKSGDLSFLDDLSENGQAVEYPEIISIHVKAPEGQSFGGQQLLIYLNRVGLRFGDMNIFHYYPHGDENAQPLFSLASAYEPGYFDIDKMDHFETKALTLFMETQQHHNVRHVFESMLNVAETLAAHLHANLYHRAWQPLTDGDLEHYQNIIDAIESEKNLV